MRRKASVLACLLTLVAVLGLLLAVLASTSGCAAFRSPRAQVHAAADGFGSLVRLLNEYDRAGLIEPDRAERIGVWMRAGYAALDSWAEAVMSEQPPDTAMEAYNRAVAALTAAILEAERATSSTERGPGDGAA